MTAAVEEVLRVIEGERRWCVVCGDAMNVLRSLPDRSIDAVVTDPPAGIAFMNAEWDKDKGGRDEWIAWLASMFIELRRVARPGAHALVWALPRTSHWTATAVENAGWTIRDVGVHLFGSGFPKSVDLAKATDKRSGHWRGRAGAVTIAAQPSKGREYERSEKGEPVTAAAAAAALQGWGSALKPASEHWILARAPLAEKTLVGNVLAYGTGGINVDATRIGYASPEDAAAMESGVESIRERGGVMNGSWKNASDLADANPASALGRWPANVTLAHLDGCRVVGKSTNVRPIWGAVPGAPVKSIGFSRRRSAPKRAEVAKVAEVAEVYQCEDGCPVKLLDEQSGDRPGMSGGGVHREDYGGGLFGGIDSAGTARGDSGGASRLFYTAKPCAAEKEKGLDWMPEETVGDGREKTNDTPRQRGATKRRNVHPTVKPVALMRWLCKLITPTGGVIVDPFAGSGTTLVAALADGFRCIGVEQSEKFAAIARARVEGDMPLLNRAGAGK